MSQNGGLVKRPLLKSVKLKAGFSWINQDVRDTKSWDTWQAKLLKGSSPRERIVLKSTKLNQSWRSTECFNVRYGDEAFGISLASF